jgi:hypothetical protein
MDDLSIFHNFPPLAPHALGCEDAAEPCGVDAPAPRLSWRLRGEGRARRQTAWRVQCATGAERFSEDGADVWDSGRIASAAQRHIVFAGRALRSSERIFWRVRVWDEADRASAWSETASWTMGVLSPGEWRARWITDEKLLRWHRAKLGHHSQWTADSAATKWVQIDLGRAQPLDEVRLFGVRQGASDGHGFPIRYKIEGSGDAGLDDAVLLADQTAEDWPWNVQVSATHAAGGACVRHVRLTATQLREDSGRHCLALGQIAVFSGGCNVAAGAAVTASDSLEEGVWSVTALTDGLGLPGANPHDNATLLLRRTFSVRPGLRRALVHVCGLGHGELTLNGARVGEDLLAPGWTTYGKTCLYDSHDVTALLHPGENAAGLFLGGGMYSVRPGRYLKFVTAFQPLTAIAQLRLEYEDGSVENVGTDETWRAHAGPVTFANVFGGEDHDARLEQNDWDRPNFDDAGWAAATGHAGPGGVLRGFSHAAPPLRAHGTLRPVTVRERTPDRRIFDFGQNAALMPRLRVRGSAGAGVKLWPAELLQTDGTLDRRSVGVGDAWWLYTLAGRPGGETWFPRFFYHGCRYVEAELSPGEDGALPAIESLEGVVVHSSTPPVGEFACSSELFNRIRTLIRWAQRSNLSHVLTDCPHRERLGWLEQYHLNGPSLRCEFDLARLFRKTFADMADAQTAGGLVPDIAPEFVQFHGGFRDSPEWGSAIILAAWQHYVWTGDEGPLREHYDAMVRYLGHLTRRATGHLLAHGLGDWCDLGPKPPGFAQLTPVALTATAFYHLDACALADIAAVLGRTADARRHRALAAEIRTAFNREFFHADTGTYATGSQTANALPLAAGLAPPGAEAGLIAALVRDIGGRGFAPTAGDVGFRHVLRALAAHGRSDVIAAMNLQTAQPGYGYQLARGATALAETWSADPACSQNHFMLGHIMEWFYADLAGLAPDPAGPGFARVIVRPQPVPGVTWARVAHDSPRGRVAVAWRIEAGGFHLDVELPPNVTATVVLPGQPARVVGSGRHEFTAPAQLSS